MLTLTGIRTDLKAARAYIGGPKPTNLMAEELWEPGAASPLGYDTAIRIYVDSVVFAKE